MGRENIIIMLLCVPTIRLYCDRSGVIQFLVLLATNTQIHSKHSHTDIICKMKFFFLYRLDFQMLNFEGFKHLRSIERFDYKTTIINTKH